MSLDVQYAQAHGQEGADFLRLEDCGSPHNLPWEQGEDDIHGP